MVPTPLRDWLTDTAWRMNAPLDYVAASCIVMLSSIIGTRLAIKPKQKDNWTIVPNLWGAIIGDPSCKKTPAIREILHPLYKLIGDCRKDFAQKQLEFERTLVDYNAQKKAYDSQQVKQYKGQETNIVPFPEPPLKPTERRYIVEDATVEKLGELLNENPTGLLVCRDELIGLLASWERAGHESDRAFYLECWNGTGSKQIDRIGRGSTFVESACLSLIGTIQPSKLLPYLVAATGYENDGFVQRLQIAVWPDKYQWKPNDECPDKVAYESAKSLIEKIVQTDFSDIAYFTDDYNRYPYTRFAPDAQKVFYEFEKKLELKILPEETGLLQEHFAKYRSLMPSLALIFHVCDVLAHNEPKEGKNLVSKQAAEMAVAWCGYLASHARRIYGLLDNAPVEGAKRLLKGIKAGKLQNGFKERDVERKGWTHLSKKEEVQDAINELIEHHYLRVLPHLPNESGGRPEAVAYSIHPNFLGNA